MPIKLVAVDIDGTLSTDDRKVTPEVFEAVQDAKEQGAKVIIAIGRPIPGVQTLLDELNLKESGDYAITFSDGLVQDTATGENIITETMTYDDYLDIEFLSRRLDVHMRTITKKGIFTANRNIGKYTVRESTPVNIPISHRTLEEMGDKEVIKMMFIDEPEILNATTAKIPQELYNKYVIVKPTPFYLEFMNKSASKGNAITHLTERMGLSKDQTMTIDDVENDRITLGAVGNPVVMENGIPELKEVAKYITKSNEESGVACAPRKWVLK